MKLLLIATIALVCCLYAAQADQLEKRDDDMPGDYFPEPPIPPTKSLAEQKDDSVRPPKSLVAEEKAWSDDKYPLRIG
uniref:Uncharacterized protein n=1 Tax=Rhodnius prolixus TaxID=13249 RepID=T1HII5_RHOPR